MNGRGRRIRWAALAAAMLAATATARAGSIWAKGQKRAQKLYADDTARNVGDSLTILIEESSKIETTRKLDKSANRTAKSGGTVDLGNMINGLQGRIWELPNIDVSASSTNKFDGKAEVET